MGGAPIDGAVDGVGGFAGTKAVPIGEGVPIGGNVACGTNPAVGELD